jgi:hypothetical protein
LKKKFNHFLRICKMTLENDQQQTTSVAAEPATTIPASEDTSSLNAEVIDDLLLDEADFVEEATPEAVPAAAPVPPLETPAPAQPPSSPAQQEQIVTQPSPVTPPVIPAGTPATTPQSPQTPPQAPVEQPQTPTQAQVSEMMAQQVSQLEQFYAIPPELVLDLHAEPEKVLPKLSAQIHMRVVTDLLKAFETRLPQVVQQVTANTTLEQKAKSTFYDRWPGLKDYEAQVLELGAMFRRMNPKATAEDTVERVGALVYASLGVPAPQAAVPPAPLAPAPQRQAFVPAMPGGAGGVTPPTTQNVFTQMATEMLTSDDY